MEQVDGTYKLQLCSTWHSRDSIDHKSTVCCEKKAEIYRVLIYQLLVCVSLCIDSHFRKRYTVSHKIVKIYLSAFPINKYKEKKMWFYITFADISCIYMTAHRRESGQKKVDLQSSFQSHAIGVFPVPIQHRHRTILLVLLRLDPSMIQWDSNS